jgi:UDP-glucose 4-epimerase
MRGDPITIFGDGSQGRCWIYVTDLAEGNVAALTESGKNEVINLAGSKFVTMNQIVDELKEIFGAINIKHEPSRPHDFEGSVTNIEKARKLLQWEPRTPFNEGLREYIQFVKSTTAES